MPGTESVDSAGAGPCSASVLPAEVAGKLPEAAKLPEVAEKPPEVSPEVEVEPLEVSKKQKMKQKKVLRAAAARAALEPPHSWSAGRRGLVGCSLVVPLAGCFLVPRSPVLGGPDRFGQVFEQVFEHYEEGPACVCSFAGVAVGSQVLFYDDEDVEDSESEMWVDECRAHCVDWVAPHEGPVQHGWRPGLV